jgi:formamidopyrimidine-DNA glycosylase
MVPKQGAFCRRVVGKRIVGIERRGKRVLMQLDDAHSIVIEPRMTGLLLLAAPPNHDHLRVGFWLRNRAASRWLWYWDRRGLGTVRLLSPRQVSAELGPRKLGPDALAITADELRERLGASRRAIKVALLDQRAVAGVGNLYASEILHAAGIHPGTLCHRLSAGRWERIKQAMREVLNTAIRYAGSTLADGTYRNALNQHGNYQNLHRVYGRAGAACPRCGRTIVRIVQAQRSTFFCPRCQRKTDSQL